jgi:hypothetical protein
MSAFAQYRDADDAHKTDMAKSYENLIKLFRDEFEMEFYEKRIENRINAMKNGATAPTYLTSFYDAVRGVNPDGTLHKGTNREVCEHAAAIFIRMVEGGKSSSIAAKTALKEGTRYLVLLEDHLESTFSVDGLRSTIKLNEVQQGQNLQLNSLSGEQTSKANKSH